MTEKLIPPTPGRVVWYHPSQHEINAGGIACADPSQPLAATVAYVHSDRMVNLSVVDQAGRQFARTSVPLVQPGDEPRHTSEGPFACWMPFQIAQAEKASLISDADLGALTALAQGMAGVEKAKLATASEAPATDPAAAPAAEPAASPAPAAKKSAPAKKAAAPAKKAVRK